MQPLYSQTDKRGWRDGSALPGDLGFIFSTYMEGRNCLKLQQIHGHCMHTVQTHMQARHVKILKIKIKVKNKDTSLYLNFTHGDRLSCILTNLWDRKRSGKADQTK